MNVNEKDEELSKKWGFDVDSGGKPIFPSGPASEEAEKRMINGIQTNLEYEARLQQAGTQQRKVEPTAEENKAHKRQLDKLMIHYKGQNNSVQRMIKLITGKGPKKEQLRQQLTTEELKIIQDVLYHGMKIAMFGFKKSENTSKEINSQDRAAFNYLLSNPEKAKFYTEMVQRQEEYESKKGK